MVLLLCLASVPFGNAVIISEALSNQNCRLIALDVGVNTIRAMVSRSVTVVWSRRWPP